MPSRYSTLLIALTACRQPEVPPPPSPGPPAAAAEAPASVMGVIVAANVSWGDALVRGDSVTLRSLYSNDAVLMTPTGDVTGPGAIVSSLMQARRPDGDSIHGTAAVTDQLDVAGDRAYEVGTLEYNVVSPQGRSRSAKVRYVNFWQLEAGTWKLRRSLRPLP